MSAITMVWYIGPNTYNKAQTKKIQTRMHYVKISGSTVWEKQSQWNWKRSSRPYGGIASETGSSSQQTDTNRENDDAVTHTIVLRRIVLVGVGYAVWETLSKLGSDAVSWLKRYGPTENSQYVWRLSSTLTESWLPTTERRISVKEATKSRNKPTPKQQHV